MYWKSEHCHHALITASSLLMYPWQPTHANTANTTHVKGSLVDVVYYANVISPDTEIHADSTTAWVFLWFSYVHVVVW